MSDVDFYQRISSGLQDISFDEDQFRSLLTRVSHLPQSERGSLFKKCSPAQTNILLEALQYKREEIYEVLMGEIFRLSESDKNEILVHAVNYCICRSTSRYLTLPFLSLVARLEHSADRLSLLIKVVMGAVSSEYSKAILLLNSIEGISDEEKEAIISWVNASRFLMALQIAPKKIEKQGSFFLYELTDEQKIILQALFPLSREDVFGDTLSELAHQSFLTSLKIRKFKFEHSLNRDILKTSFSEHILCPEDFDLSGAFKGTEKIVCLREILESFSDYSRDHVRVKLPYYFNALYSFIGQVLSVPENLSMFSNVIRKCIKESQSATKYLLAIPAVRTHVVEKFFYNFFQQESYNYLHEFNFVFNYSEENRIFFPLQTVLKKVQQENRWALFLEMIRKYPAVFFDSETFDEDLLQLLDVPSLQALKNKIPINLRKKIGFLFDEDYFFKKEESLKIFFNVMVEGTRESFNLMLDSSFFEPFEYFRYVHDYFSYIEASELSVKEKEYRKSKIKEKQLAYVKKQSEACVGIHLDKMKFSSVDKIILEKELSLMPAAAPLSLVIVGATRNFDEAIKKFSQLLQWLELKGFSVVANKIKENEAIRVDAHFERILNSIEIFCAYLCVALISEVEDLKSDPRTRKLKDHPLFSNDSSVAEQLGYCSEGVESALENFIAFFSGDQLTSMFSLVQDQVKGRFHAKHKTYSGNEVHVDSAAILGEIGLFDERAYRSDPYRLPLSRSSLKALSSEIIAEFSEGTRTRYLQVENRINLFRGIIWATPDSVRALNDLLQALTDVGYSFDEENPLFSLLQKLTGVSKEICDDWFEKATVLKVSKKAEDFIRIIALLKKERIEEILKSPASAEAIETLCDFKAVMNALREKGFSQEEWIHWVSNFKLEEKAGRLYLVGKDTLLQEVQDKLSFLVFEEKAPMGGAGGPGRLDESRGGINEVLLNIRLFLTEDGGLTRSLETSWNHILHAPDGLYLIKRVIVELKREGVQIRADRILYQTPGGESLYTAFAKNSDLAEWMTGVKIEGLVVDGDDDGRQVDYSLSDHESGVSVIYEALVTVPEESKLRRDFDMQAEGLFSAPGALNYFLGHLRQDDRYRAEGSILTGLMDLFSQASCDPYRYETFLDALIGLKSLPEYRPAFISFLEERLRVAEELAHWSSYFSMAVLLEESQLTREILEKIVTSEQWPVLSREILFLRNFYDMVLKSSPEIKRYVGEILCVSFSEEVVMTAEQAYFRNQIKLLCDEPSFVFSDAMSLKLAIQYFLHHTKEEMALNDDPCGLFAHSIIVATRSLPSREAQEHFLLNLLLELPAIEFNYLPILQFFSQENLALFLNDERFKPIFLHQDSLKFSHQILLSFADDFSSSSGPLLAFIATLEEADKFPFLSRIATKLIIATRHQPTALQSLLVAIEKLSDVDKAWIFKQVDLTNQQNALTIALFHQPTAVRPLLAFIETLPQADKTLILKQASVTRNNVLMMAACYQPTEIEPFLAVIATLPEADKISILTQVNLSRMNALMLAAQYQPEAVEPLLRIVETLSEPGKVSILKLMDSSKQNALMIAAQHQPTAVEPLLRSIQTLEEVDRESILKQMNSTRQDALTIALLHQPTAVQPLFAFIATLQGVDKLRALRKVNNQLISVVKFKPEAVEPFLNFIRALSEADKAFILKQANGYGKNVLITAARYQPAIALSLLAVIEILPQADKALILKQTNLYRKNVLMTAACYQPATVEPLLRIIETLPDADRVEILKQVNVNGLNALMIAAVYQPEAVEPLLRIIGTLLEIDKRSILKQVDVNGLNAVMIAARYQPRVFGPLLGFIATTTSSGLIQENFLYSVLHLKGLLVDALLKRDEHSSLSDAEYLRLLELSIEKDGAGKPTNGLSRFIYHHRGIGRFFGERKPTSSALRIEAEIKRLSSTRTPGVVAGAGAGAGSV